MVNIHPQRTIAHLASACQRPYEEMSSLFLSPVHLDFMSGRLTPTGFYQAVVDAFDVEIGFTAFVDIWNQLIGAPKNGIVGLVNQLKGPFKLSVCSNTDPLHWRQVRERDDFLEVFDRFFLSYQLDLLKPEKGIFQRLLGDLSCLPGECLFIDDTLENIHTADKLGFYTLHTHDPTGVVKHPALKNALKI